MLQSCFTKRRLCLVLVVLLVSCSCLSTIAFAATEKTPRLSASSHTFEYGGGAGRVNVYDANKVTVACPVSWVSVRTDTTQKYIQVVMNVGVNKGKARDATITVYTEKGTLKFKVYQKASGFSVFTPDGSVCTNFHIVGGTPTGEKLSYTFNTNAYGAVRVTSQASWLSASIEIPSKIIHITADLNLTGAVRTTTFIVYDQLNQSRAVTVKQEPWDFDINNSKVVLSKSGATIPATFKVSTIVYYKTLCSLSIDKLTEKACQDFANALAAEFGVTAPKIYVRDTIGNFQVSENCHYRPNNYHTCPVYLSDGGVLFDKEYLKKTFTDKEAAENVASDIIYTLRKAWQKKNAKFNGTKNQYILQYSLNHYIKFRLNGNFATFKSQFIERDAHDMTVFIISRLKYQD